MMNEALFDKGEVEVLSRWQHLGRISYFARVSLPIIPGTIIAISYLLMSPQDALYVVPIALIATSIGSNTAYHMYFTHHTFTTGRLFRGVLAFLGTILCQDSIAQWVANHKRHHRHTDIVKLDDITQKYLFLPLSTALPTLFVDNFLFCCASGF
jgi:stearoyl-CoA desaturase (delta-9 desaturase)